jgi:hypothetical protein
MGWLEPTLGRSRCARSDLGRRKAIPVKSLAGLLGAIGIALLLLGFFNRPEFERAHREGRRPGTPAEWVPQYLRLGWGALGLALVFFLMEVIVSWRR